MNNKTRKTNLRTLLSLAPHEKTMAFAMFLYSFILLNTLYLLKPVRDSLFLEQVGSHNLPFVFIFTAIAVIPISIGYSKISKRMTVDRLIYSITLFLAANLLLIWYFIEMDSHLLYYGFYIWVSIYSVLITSQFWLFANDIFTSTQAKKIFSFLSLGAIVGAFSGGEITGLLINRFAFSPESLLLVSACVLIATLGMVFWIGTLRRQYADFSRPASRPAESTSTYSDNPITEILNNRHLLLITALIGITVVTTTIIDFQFKTFAENAFVSESELTSFMGRFYGRISLISFFIQLLAGAYFTKKYGVSGAIMLLPVALLISSGGMLLLPGLAAGTMARGVDQALKHSIDRTGRELLFVPLAEGLKKRVKVFIDLFVDHGAQGLAGLLLIGVTFGLNLTPQGITMMLILLLFLWIGIARMTSKSYINQFRRSLKLQVNPESHHQRQSKQAIQESSFTTLLELLQSERDSEVISALNRLRTTDNNIPEKHLRSLLNHSNSIVRRKTLLLIREQELPDFVDDVISLIYDPDPDLRMEAVKYIYRFHDDNWIENLQAGLTHDDLQIKSAALGLVAEEGGSREHALVTDDILRQALEKNEEDAGELRHQTAKVLGRVYTPNRAWMLRELLEDRSPVVVREAIKSAGKIQDRQFVDRLIYALGNESYRASAEKALASYGDKIFGTLFDYMTDPAIKESTRRYIPYIFSHSPSEGAWKILVMSLGRCSIPVRHGVIKALMHIRLHNDGLCCEEALISENLYIEIKRHSQLKKALFLYDEGGLPETQKLRDVLDYEIEQSFENIFRFLSLFHSFEDISNAYEGITGSDPALRADAIELLENLISWEVRKILLPLLENYTTHSLGTNTFARELTGWKDSIQYLKSLEHTGINKEINHLFGDRQEGHPEVELDPAGIQTV